MISCKVRRSNTHQRNLPTLQKSHGKRCCLVITDMQYALTHYINHQTKKGGNWQFCSQVQLTTNLMAFYTPTSDKPSPLATLSCNYSSYVCTY